MVNIEILRKRINKLEEYLRILSRICRYSYEEFLKNRSDMAPLNVFYSLLSRL